MKKVKRKYTSARKVAEKMDQGRGVSYMKLPKGCEDWYRFKVKNNKFDILPFEAGDGNPNADAGAYHWERTVFVHNNIGPQDKKVVCLAQTCGKKCPVCEYTAKLMRAGNLDEDTRKALKPKQRIVCLVRDHDDGMKVKCLEHSFLKGFGEVMKDKLMAIPEDSPSHDFFHLDGGCALNVLCKESSVGEGGKYIEPSTIEFFDRKKPIDESLMEDMQSPDECLIEMKYEDLKELFEEGATSKGSEETEEDEEDDTDDEDDDEEEKPKKKVKDKKKVSKKEEDEDEEDDTDDEEEEEEEEEEDDTDDEEEEDADEDGEGGEEEDSEDGEEDTEGPEVTVGCTVKYQYRNKVRTGTVKKVNKKNGVALVDIGEERPASVDLDDLTVVEEEEEDEDEEITKSKKSGSKGKKAKGKVVEEEEDEDEDSDEDTDEDDEEEDEEPVKKKRKK